MLLNPLGKKGAKRSNMNIGRKLQHRAEQVRQASYTSYAMELGFFVKFLRSTPHIASLLNTLPQIDFERLCEGLPDAGVMGGGYFQFEGSEEERARFLYEILDKCCESDSTFCWVERFSGENHADAMLLDFNRAILDPFVSFLLGRIEDSSHLLHILQRFKRKVEWFRSDQFLEHYRSGGEKSLDHALREGLFDAGIEFPFSQPVSPSGRADVVSSPESENPLVLEIKVFDPDESRGPRNLRQGFHQLIRYANDYNQNIGYLVIFNCSDSQIVLPSDAESQVPPRLVYGEKTYFLLSIDVGPNRLSASRENPRGRLEIAREDLVGA